MESSLNEEQLELEELLCLFLPPNPCISAHLDNAILFSSR